MKRRKYIMSPRQKMINLMYVVLMALLAINVSAEVLDGFNVITESLNRTTTNTAEINTLEYQRMEKKMKDNPNKARQWYSQAITLKQKTIAIENFIQHLKNDIAKEADGKDGDPQHLINKEDLEAANQIMLAPHQKNGQQLYQVIKDYKIFVSSLMNDKKHQKLVDDILYMTTGNESWEERLFGNMPAIAAISILTKIQNDIRYTENIAIRDLMENIDEKDIRVNKLQPYVIPEAKTVIKGNAMKAKIVLAAVDTTQKPLIVIEDRQIDNGLYETICNRTGNFTLKGFVEVKNPQGERVRTHFEEDYSVIEPYATVAADLTNILYAGYDNPVSISVPGVPLTALSATTTNGTLTQTAPGRFVAKPTKVGEAVITVYATSNGKKQVMTTYAFNVRKLPAPTPFLNVRDEKNNKEKYTGGAIRKQQLMTTETVDAAIDDGILNVPFIIKSFETIFFDQNGNAVSMASEKNRFSARQKDTFRKLTRGRRFYISHIIAIGPDNIERKLNTSIEIIVR